MSNPRLLIAAAASGSGKTLITCGLLQALKNRGMDISSFKCGPDYIDPMFHEKILGKKSYNLDSFFCEEDILKYLLESNSNGTDISVIEGVMGYYDGIAGIFTDDSAYDIAKKTNTPTFLVIDCKGSSVSLAAMVKGFAEFRKDSNIKGVILNKISEMIYPGVKKLIEDETSVKVMGFVPKLEGISLESRHLGLVLPDEIKDIKEQVQIVAETLEKTLDIDEMLRIANEAGSIYGKRLDADESFKGEKNNINIDTCFYNEKYNSQITESDFREKLEKYKDKWNINVAIAKDEAFCFIYEDNIKVLEEFGARVQYFSPLNDEKLPENVDGIILPGGYPELFAEKLSQNRSMIESIKNAIQNEMPCIAECGGFMYLHNSMEDMNGKNYEMVGIVDGDVYKTSKLSRFGYITLEKAEVFGKTVGDIPAHEFHYFHSTNSGTSFKAQKPKSKRGWETSHSSETLLAGFPHIHFYGNLDVCVGFFEACARK